MVESLGRRCARHPWRVVAAWLLLVGCLLGAVAGLGKVTSESVTIPGSDSQAAVDTAAAAFPGTATTVPLVLHAGSGTLDGDADRAAVERSAQAVARVPHVTAVTTPFQSGQSGALSADHRTAYLSIGLDVSGRAITPDLTGRITAAAAPATAAGLQVTPGGDLGAAVSKADTQLSERIGIAAAAVILLIALGGVVAAGLPLLLGLTGLAVSLAAVGLIGHLMDMPSAGATIAAMIGLGVGIDYTLFCLTRYRALRAAGSNPVDAAAATAATAGKAVCFAGCAVITALAGLALGGLSLLHALALAPAVAVLVAMAAAVTLLPALLVLLGPRLESLRLERLRPRSRRRPPAPAATDAGTATPAPRGWARTAGHIADHPWRYLVAGTTLLAVLAAPAAALTFGGLDNGSKPRGSAARTAYDQLTTAFGPGTGSPLLIVDTLPDGAPATGADDPRLTALGAALQHTAGVASVGPAQLAPDGRHARWQLLAGTAPSDPATTALVTELRAHTLPAASAGTGQRLHVGGAAAAQADLNARLAARLPWIIATVVTIATLLLLLAFRAPVVAVKAAVMNLLSVGAAYGVLTAVFHWGWGARLIGLDGPVPIEGYVPLLMFAVLFGLSMDYEVFLLTAVREAFTRDGDNRASVVTGLAETGRVITSASLIMVSVFTGYVLVADPVVKMFGLGLATAIGVDATVVRGVLVPATMVLLGRANWWLPGWLDRLLPHVAIEGPADPAPHAEPTPAPVPAPAPAATAVRTPEPRA
ncbi:MMPL family transporter [Kitasatospora nipponensis]|uniref:MMPL family transporter n=1 Tax=Kitasatospora nipponensis TaxID=258049 RepID=A0ABN1X1C0_9ACTN